MKRVALACALLVACEPRPATTGPARVELPATDGARHEAAGAAPHEAPPPSGARKEWPFPAVAMSRLTNGLGVHVVSARTLPIVEVRLLVRAGANAGSAGVGELTARMLKDGGSGASSGADVVRRIETLGTNLDVRVDADGTVLGLALTRDKLEDGLALLSQVVREPRFDAEELRRTKARLKDEVEDAARSNGSWTASWVVFHELYPEGHPYAVRGILPSQVTRIDAAQLRDVHRRFYVPKAATVVLAGDIDDLTGRALAQKHLGAWTGGEPPKLDPPPPRAPDRTRVVVAHRPGSAQSDVLVAMLAPERRSDRYPGVRVANHILGGGPASRLFADIREQRSLAYRTGAQLLEVALGAQPLVVHAGTETRQTALAVSGLLENLARMRSSPPSVAEVANARRFLGDVFAIRMETVGALADMVVTQAMFGLPEGYWDAYRAQLRAVATNEAAEAAITLYGDRNLVVVAGDADAVAESLTRFGAVTVVDPEKDFKPMKTLQAQPARSTP